MNILRRAALAALVLAPFALANPLHAQTTPEGTVITNTATASWTDANSNAYTAVTASAAVTVGFLGGPDVSSAGSVTPASPSTGNQLAFTITNKGNGTDSVTVSPTAGSGVTITGYVLGGTTYPTLPELNVALAGTPIPADGVVTVTVVYTVAPGQGGGTIPVSLTATSRRDSGKSDASTTDVKPPKAPGAGLTPGGGGGGGGGGVGGGTATASRLPSNGTTYSHVFTLSNTGNSSETYSLLGATSDGAVVIAGSMSGTGLSGGQVTIAAGGSVDITYTYTVGDVAAGSTADLTVTATSTTDATVSATAKLTVTVIRAAITMAKDAFRDDATTAIGAGDRVLPGEYIRYRVTVTNDGDAAATTVSISDPLPSQVTYQSASGDAAGWTIVESSGTVTASLASLAKDESRFFWIRVRIK